jgi:hypothetical protein
VGNPFRNWEEAQQKGTLGREEFTRALADIAGKMGLTTGHGDGHGVLHAPGGPGDTRGFLVIAPNKSEARAREKVSTDYKNDWTQLKDMVRGSIVVNTVAEVAEAFKNAEAAGLKFAAQPKDRFSKPTPEGYRDLNTLVTLPSGILAELQFHVRELSDAKAEGHKHYEAQRTLRASNGMDEPTDAWSPEEAAEFHQLRQAQREIYDAAWAKVPES